MNLGWGWSTHPVFRVLLGIPMHKALGEVMAVLQHKARQEWIENTFRCFRTCPSSAAVFLILPEARSPPSSFAYKEATWPKVQKSWRLCFASLTQGLLVSRVAKDLDPKMTWDWEMLRWDEGSQGHSSPTNSPCTQAGKKVVDHRTTER